MPDSPMPDNLTGRALDRAVAEALGWTEMREAHVNHGVTACRVALIGASPLDKVGEVPHYSTSHDVCQEIIDHVQCHDMEIQYVHAFRWDGSPASAIAKKLGMEYIPPGAFEFEMLLATPEQKCRAFLAVMETGNLETCGQWHLISEPKGL
jgi:hypothetical protein